MKQFEISRPFLISRNIAKDYHISGFPNGLGLVNWICLAKWEELVRKWPMADYYFKLWDSKPRVVILMILTSDVIGSWLDWCQVIISYIKPFYSATHLRIAIFKGPIFWEFSQWLYWHYWHEIFILKFSLSAIGRIQVDLKDEISIVTFSCCHP